MMNSQSKYIDYQSFPPIITYKKICYKTINHAQIWLQKLGKWILGEMKIGKIVHCHEETINLGLRLMMNNMTHLMNGQSGLLKFADWKHW